MKNRLDEPATNGNGKPADPKLQETSKPEQAVPTPIEKRRDATDLDEVSIRLWNAYNDLATREDELLGAVTALVQERKKGYMNGQADLRGRFQMPPAPKIEAHPDGTRELVWSEMPVKDSK